MFQLKKTDTVLFGCMFSLILIGVLMIFSTSPVIGSLNYNDSYFFIKRHLVYLLLGCFTFLFGFFIPVDYYKRYAFIGFVISNILLLLTFLPGIGISVGGANRWLDLGLFHFQPVEVSKFFTIVFFALAIDSKKERLNTFKTGILPLLLVLSIPLLILVNHPDLSNIVLISCVCFFILFLGRLSYKYLVSILGVGVVFFIVTIVFNPYQLDRIRIFLFPHLDPYGKGYHITQSLITVGSGGVLGVGIGQSKMKYLYLPLHYSDFIFSIICEEGGFIFASFVVVLFGVFFYRGIVVALRQRSIFLFYLALGLTMLIVFQAIINIGVAISIFPVTGMPLTFISFGGTSLVMSMFFVGILSQLSRLP